MYESLVLKKKEEKTISFEEIVHDLSNEAVFNTNNEDIKNPLMNTKIENKNEND